MVTIDGQWVEFRFYRPDARKVALAGTFRETSPELLPMVRSDQGYWVARLQLPPGEFRFRYQADGESYPDYAAFGLEAGRFGWESIVRVPRAPAPPAVAEPAAADAA